MMITTILALDFGSATGWAVADLLVQAAGAIMCVAWRIKQDCLLPEGVATGAAEAERAARILRDLAGQPPGA